MKQKKFSPRQVAKYLFQTLMVCVLVHACSGDNALETNLQDDIVSNVEKSPNSNTTKIVPTEIDTALLARLRTQTRAFHNNPSISPEEYELFHSNIYELRELPIRIQVRGTGSKTGRFFSCRGAGQEVTLSKLGFSHFELFYLRILPASSGIPYLIYSNFSRTPLAVGQYTNNPNKKVLYAQPNDNGSTFMIGWDLIPSNYRGYFAIKSTTYVGTSDPSNPWSVFNYYLEALNENTIGYGKYSNKAEQEFLIEPMGPFTIDHIEFDKSSAKVTKRTPLEVVSYGKNETEEQRPFTITAAHYATNSFVFVDKSILKIPFVGKEMFYSPKVEAGRLVVPSPINPNELEQKGFERNMQYTNNTQNTRITLKFDVNGNAKPNSLIEVTSWLENYNVSVNYIVHMKHTTNKDETRIVKLNGTWYGTLYTTKRAKPDIIKFFDLDDGEELLRAKSKNVKLQKTILR